MNRERHPKLTPSRALDLLLDMGVYGTIPTMRSCDDIRRALTSHVRAAITKNARRLRRRVS